MSNWKKSKDKLHNNCCGDNANNGVKSCSCEHSHSDISGHSHKHGGNHDDSREQNHADNYTADHGSGGIELDCGCGHDHGKGKINIPQWVLYARMAASAMLLIIGVIIDNTATVKYLSLGLYIASFVIIGYDIVWRMLKNIIKGKIFDENLLMTIAAIGAFVIGESPEAALVLLLYQVGEKMQDLASVRSTKAIGSILDIRVDEANLVVGDEIRSVKAQNVVIGDIVMVKVGEKVPLDGTVTEGESYIDTSALTGESVPRAVRIGEQVLAGCINQNSAFRMRVDKVYSESTASKIIETVKNINAEKSPTEKFITRFARIYTPIVVLAAVLLALIPSLITGNAQEWIYRAITFLVISCPCALVISVPMSYFSGIGSASKRGILIKGGVFIDYLAAARNVVMDKTGTLTEGVFAVREIKAVGISEQDLLNCAAQAEFYSNHPIAKAITEHAAISVSSAQNAEEIAGKGMVCDIDGVKLAIGNAKLMSDFDVIPLDVDGTSVHVAIDGKYRGYIVISDRIKPNSTVAIAQLKNMDIDVTMLTGDNATAAARIGTEIGIDNVFSELLPTDKADELAKIMAISKSTVFVGDGINDAPVIAAANVGVAMGGLGADAAIEAADAVIMNDDPLQVVTAIKIAKKTKCIVIQNIVVSLAVKLTVLILGAVGLANIWLALFADVGISIIAVFNALRALRIKENSNQLLQCPKIN